MCHFLNLLSLLNGNTFIRKVVPQKPKRKDFRNCAVQYSKCELRLIGFRDDLRYDDVHVCAEHSYSFDKTILSLKKHRCLTNLRKLQKAYISPCLLQASVTDRMSRYYRIQQFLWEIDNVALLAETRSLLSQKFRCVERESIFL